MNTTTVPASKNHPAAMWLAGKYRRILACMTMITAMPALAPLANAEGQIDESTLVEASHGTFRGVKYTRYEAMFEGVTSSNRPYRVPCQIVAPANPVQGSGLLLFDWLVPSTVVTAVGQEQADARYVMTDKFLFSQGLSYATVRCDPACLGKQSPVPDPTRPWSDGLLDTSSEFISSAGDEFDIVVDYVKALRSDPVAVDILGTVTRSAAFSYSAGGYKLRGLLRSKAGIGLFNFSLVGGTGNGFDHPSGNAIGFSAAEKPPLTGAGLEIDIQSETDVVAAGGHKTRHEESNYRVYQFAGAAHLRDIDVEEFGLAAPQDANPARWEVFFRALFVAGVNWCKGIAPPPSLWLGAPNDPSVARDGNGNALVRYVGGQPVSTDEYRLPEVAVGENQYIPYDPTYEDGTFLGSFRAIAGSHVDLTSQFTNHDVYVGQIIVHAMQLQSLGYLLQADADAIIRQAIQSDIGNP
jgi:hypothetical protein